MSAIVLVTGMPSAAGAGGSSTVTVSGADVDTDTGTDDSAVGSASIDVGTELGNVGSTPTSDVLGAELGGDVVPAFGGVVVVVVVDELGGAEELGTDDATELGAEDDGGTDEEGVELDGGVLDDGGGSTGLTVGLSGSAGEVLVKF